MKLLFFLALALGAAAGAARLTTTAYQPASLLNDINTLKRNNAISCGPDRLVMEQWLEETDIPPMPGAGKYKWKINTKSDSAQFYFNQGINMYYGFHIIESLASFKKAATFDSENPAIWWAQALAYGPNINDVSYAVLPQALEAVDKANALLEKASPVEKALIGAISVRYSKDTTLAREKLNATYTKAMETLYGQYPANADVAALYVDAMMLEHPWELWNINGTPKPWTPTIRTVLEKTLVKNPEHPGINHYYIHVMEPSPYPEKAMASADRLGKLNPGLAHLVHMPSHIYLRTGYYGKGYRVNEEAVKQFSGYLQLFPAVAGGEFLYRLHNEHMLINCAMHAGRKQYTISKSLDFQKTLESFLSEPGAMGNYLQYIYMVPTLAMIRFEDWNGLLAAPVMDSSHVYAALLSHFGRGMALANTGNINEAEAELDKVRALVKDSVLSLPFTPFSPAIDGAVIAENMLAGTIALAKKNNEDALSYFTTAVEREKNMVYNEPRDWLLNPKYYLADAYFKAGKWKEAEATFNQDLKDNNENVWSLAGLHKTLQQRKSDAAAKVAARLKKAAKDSDVF
ncbi:MAG: tetratricopeptide repeat protein [Agriterribacter sp.]